MQTRRNAHPIFCSLAVIVGVAALALSVMCVVAIVRGEWHVPVAAGAFGMALLGVDLVWSGVAGKYPLSAEFFILGDPP